MPDRLRLGLAAVAFAVVLGLAAVASSAAVPLSARDRNWQQDIAYLASELPVDRMGGLGAISPQDWGAAATRLEAAVPQ